MRNYEIMFIVRPTLSEDEVKKVVDPKRVRGENWDEEIALMANGSKAAFEYSSEIVQVISSVTKKEQEIFVFASDGTWQVDGGLQIGLGFEWKSFQFLVQYLLEDLFLRFLQSFL